MKSQAWGKAIGLAIVLALLLWGLGQITDVVTQRQAQRQVAVQNIAQSLAGAQTLIGPVLHTTCTEEWVAKTKVDGQDAVQTERRTFTLSAAPSLLGVNGTAQTEARARGLHATQVLHLKTTLMAQWNDLAALQPQRSQPNSTLQCQPAWMMLAVSDARGIRQVDVQVNGVAMPVRSGTVSEAYPRGIHTVLPEGLDAKGVLNAQIQLELVGTERLSIVPLGTANHIQLRSNWPHPSFGGQFLPLERQISDSGFSATWRVSALASTAQQDVLNQHPLCATNAGGEDDRGDAPHTAPADKACTETLGVTFVDPTNTYALSDRATKYGLLFIALTFVAVGLFELMRSLRVHPVQYLLVGAAISIFFLLLVSLSEHLPFATAYVVAASACVVLLSFYASHMLQSWRRGLPFGASIATLYGLLYVLLQLEQKALVVGAVALFAVLALVMTLTRKVDWYAQFQRVTQVGSAQD